MIGYILLGLFVAFLLVLVIRALCFNPKPQPDCTAAPVSFDRDAATDALAQLEDNAEFEKLVNLLPTLYPRVFAVCSFQKLPDRALLLRWPGKSDAASCVMMAHYDVVPADEEKWEKPPFAGIIENGILWGRGTLDTKATLNGTLFAANCLISQGFVPEHDIYFAFSGGEEVNGKGAVNIVNYFVENKIQPALVLDEGGAVVENVFPGVSVPSAMIGIAEKGMINAQYSVSSGGGHASAPLPKTPVTTLAKACRQVIEHPIKMQLTTPVAAMFDTLARYSSFAYKLIFANLWCFKPVLDMICKSSGGDMNALVRTTTAFTQMEGSSARNVIPTRASMVSNMRLNPADSVASAVEYLRKTVNDSSVEITVLESHEPSPISELNCPAWDKVALAVAQTWQGCVVTPYLMVQCSDSRHYRDLSRHVYRFSAMDLTSDERKTIHGNNERIRLDCIAKSVEFYLRLLGNC